MRVKILFFTIILFSFISELEVRGKGKKMVCILDHQKE